MVQPGPGQPQVDNNMRRSIISLFLFWPLAIPAISNASKANQHLQHGDIASAQAASAESRKWSKRAITTGLVIWGLALLCCVVSAIVIVAGGGIQGM